MMLIERHAHTNRWRSASPEAKALFALLGLGAAFLAATPRGAFLVALGMGVVTLAGPRIRPWDYLCLLLPPLGFLLVSVATLVFSLPGTGQGLFHMEPAGFARAAQVSGRALGGLSALLFLSLSTPMGDLIGLLRRIRVPEMMLDLMVLCYRTLFVLSDSVRDTLTAQSARLGYATVQGSFRSLGALSAGLLLQVWHRAADLHQSSLARNGEGTLRFLEEPHPGAARQVAWALLGGAALIVLARVAP